MICNNQIEDNLHHFKISRLLTGASADQSANATDPHEILKQQLSNIEKTFLSLLLTNSTHAKDLMAKKTVYEIANDQSIIKAGMFRKK